MATSFLSSNQWLSYKDSTSAYPLTGTTTGSSLSSPISNTVSSGNNYQDLIFNQPAGAYQGQGWSIPFSINNQVVPQIQVVQFYYKFSGTASTLNVYIVDPVGVSTYLALNAISVSSTWVLFNSSFTPSASYSTYYLCIHNIASSNTTAGVLEVSDIVITISAITQPANDNSTKVATTAYVDRIALPIGTIIAFDANRTAGLSGGGTGGWTDNVTLVGWYACIAGNTATWGCPDLSGNSYLSGKVVAGSGTTFGTNSYLSVAQLASHNHTGTTDSTGINHTHTGTTASTDINHTHTGSTGYTNTDHTHGGSTGYSGVPIQISNGFGGGGYNGDYISSGQNYYGAHNHTSHNHSFTTNGQNSNGTHYHAFTTDPNNPAHTHTFTTDATNPAHTHTFSTTTQGSGSAIDNRPASYSIIWIRKCS